jgi:hypothetical protein
MTKLVSRIATAVAILGLGAPAFAATSGASTSSPSVAPVVKAHHRTHRKVAQADEKKATTKDAKVEKAAPVKDAKKASPAKTEKKGAASKEKGAAAKTPAPAAPAAPATPSSAPATPAPAPATK